MRLAGFVAPAADLDSRSRGLLVPTERLIEAHRRRWRYSFEAMAMLMPEERHALVMLDQEAFTLSLVRHLGRVGLGGFRLMNYAPELTRLVERNAGL